MKICVYFCEFPNGKTEEEKMHLHNDEETGSLAWLVVRMAVSQRIGLKTE